MDPIVGRIDSEIVKIENDGKEDIDNYALMLLLKGVCLRYKKQYENAVECFKEVITLYVDSTF